MRFFSVNEYGMDAPFALTQRTTKTTDEQNHADRPVRMAIEIKVVCSSGKALIRVRWNHQVQTRIEGFPVNRTVGGATRPANGTFVLTSLRLWRPRLPASSWRRRSRP